VLLDEAGASGAGAALAFLVFVVLFFTGVNAQGLLLMDQAQGLQPRGIVDAIVYGLFCIPKEIAIFIGLVLAVIVAMIAVAVVLFLCKIPGIGPAMPTSGKHLVSASVTLAAAMSSGWPILFWGICSRKAWRTASGRTDVMSDSMKPGATALTVTLREASSRAAVLVRPVTACLVAV